MTTALLLKGVDHGGRRPLKLGLGMRVVGDDVDLAPHPPEELGELRGVGERVVHSGEEHVLECDPAPLLERVRAQRS
jgi:hypothetical protein